MAQVQGSKEQILISAYNDGYEFFNNYKDSYKQYFNDIKAEYDKTQFWMKVLGYSPLGWLYNIGKGVYNGVVSLASGLVTAVGNFANNFYQVLNQEASLTTEEGRKELLGDISYMFMSGMFDMANGVSNSAVNFIGNVGAIVGVEGSQEWATKTNEFITNKMNRGRYAVMSLDYGQDPSGMLRMGDLKTDEDYAKYIENHYNPDIAKGIKESNDMFSKAMYNEDIFAPYMGDDFMYQIQTGIFENLGRMLPSIAMTYFGVNPALSSGYFFGTSYGQAYMEATQKGLSLSDANTYAMGVASVETLTEEIGGFKFGSGISGNLASNFAGEAVEEIIAELTTQNVTYDEKGNAVYESPKDILSRVGMAGLIGGLSGGVMAGGNIVLNRQTMGTKYQTIEDVSGLLETKIKEDGLEKVQSEIRQGLDVGLEELNKTVSNPNNLKKTLSTLQNAPASSFIQFNEKSNAFELTELGKNIYEDIGARQDGKAISKTGVYSVGFGKNVRSTISTKVNGENVKTDVNIVEQDSQVYKDNKQYVDKAIAISKNTGLDIVVFDGGKNGVKGFYADGISYLNIAYGQDIVKQVAGHELFHQIFDLAKKGKLNDTQSRNFNRLTKDLAKAIDQDEDFKRVVLAKMESEETTAVVVEEALANFIEKYVNMDKVIDSLSVSKPSLMRLIIKSLIGMRKGGNATSLEQRYVNLLNKVDLKKTYTLEQVMLASRYNFSNPRYSVETLDKITVDGKIHPNAEYFIKTNSNGEAKLTLPWKEVILNDNLFFNSPDIQEFISYIKNGDVAKIVDNFMATTERKHIGFKYVMLHEYLKTGENLSKNKPAIDEEQRANVTGNYIDVLIADGYLEIKDKLFQEIDRRILELKNKFGVGQKLYNKNLIKVNYKVFREVLGLNYLKIQERNFVSLYEEEAFKDVGELYLRSDFNAGFLVSESKKTDSPFFRNELASIFNSSDKRGFVSEIADFAVEELGATNLTAISHHAYEFYYKVFKDKLALYKTEDRFFSQRYNNGIMADDWSILYSNWIVSEITKQRMDSVLPTDDKVDTPTYANIYDYQRDLRFRDSQNNPITSNIIDYFKDSKVRDAEERLLVTYHGSLKKGFTVFDSQKSGMNFPNGIGTAFFFTDDISLAKQFAKKQGEVRQFYLNIVKPLDIGNMSQDEMLTIAKYDKFGLGEKTQERITYEISYINSALERGDHQAIVSLIDEKFLKDNGYDGIIARRYKKDVSIEIAKNPNAKEYVVLNSNQAKLITNLKPTADDDIRYSKEDEYGKINVYGQATNVADFSASLSNMVSFAQNYEDEYTAGSDSREPYLKKGFVNKINGMAEKILAYFRSEILDGEFDAENVEQIQFDALKKINDEFATDDTIEAFRTITEEVDNGEYPNDEPPSYDYIQELVDYLEDVQNNFEGWSEEYQKAKQQPSDVLDVKNSLMNLNKTQSDANWKNEYDNLEKKYREKVASFKVQKGVVISEIIGRIIEDTEKNIRSRNNQERIYNHVFVDVAKYVSMTLSDLLDNGVTILSKDAISVFISGINKTISTAQKYMDSTFRDNDVNVKDPTNPNGFQYTRRIYWGIRDVLNNADNDYSKDARLSPLTSIYASIIDLKLDDKNTLYALYNAISEFKRATDVQQVNSLALDSEGEYAHTIPNVKQQANEWINMVVDIIGQKIPVQKGKRRIIERQGGIFGKNSYLDTLRADKWIADPFTFAEVASMFVPNALPQVMFNRIYDGSKKQMHIVNHLTDYFEEGGWLKKNRKNIDELEKNYVDIKNLSNNLGGATNMALSQVIALYNTLKREIVRNKLIDEGYVDGEKTTHFTDGNFVKIAENTKDKVSREAQGRESKVVDQKALLQELQDIIYKNDFMKMYNKKVMDYFETLYPYVNYRFKDINGLELSNDAETVRSTMSNMSEEERQAFLEDLPSGIVLDSMYIPYRQSGQSYMNKGAFDAENILDLGIFDGITQALGSSPSMLLIDSINNLIPAYSREVANYYGMYRVTRDLNELFGTQEKVEGTEEQKFSLSQKMDNINPEIVKYYEELIKDIAGYTTQKEGVSQSFDKALAWLRKNFFKASLALNVKVLSTQFASMIVTGSMFGEGNNPFSNSIFMAKFMKNVFMAGSKNKSKYLIENSDVYKNRSKMSTYELSEATDKTWNKGVVNEATEFLMRGITVTDNMINRALFITLRETLNPKTGQIYSEEEAKEITELAIHRYQSSGDPISRSELLRTENQILRLFTKFLGEPMKMLTNFYGVSKHLRIISMFEQHREEIKNTIIKKIDDENKKVEIEKNDYLKNEAFVETEEFKKLSNKAQREYINKLSKQKNKLAIMEFTARQKERILKNFDSGVSEVISSKTDTRKQLGRLVSAFAGSYLWQVLLGVVFQMLRGKLKDKPEGEEQWAYISAMIGRQMGVEFVGYFPFLRDIYSVVVSGYSATEIDELQAINDLLMQFSYLITDITNGGDFNAGRHIRQFATTLGHTLGIPVRNIERLFTTPLGWFSASGSFSYKSATGQQVNVNKELKMAVANQDESLIEAIVKKKMDERNINLGQDVTDEIERLAMVNGETISISGDYGKFTIDGIQYVLDGEQQKKFTETYNKADYIASKVIKSAEYKQLDDKYKAKFISAIFSYYYRMAKQIVSGEELIAEKFFFENLSTAYEYFITTVAKRLYNAMIKEQEEAIA